MRMPFTPSAAWESLKATLGPETTDATGLGLLVGVAACADLGTSAAVAGGSLAVTRARGALKERAGLDSNHRLLSLVHRARWRAMAVIARDLDNEFHAGGGGADTASFKTDAWLEQIHKRALEQARSDLGQGRDARDLERARKPRRKTNKTSDKDASRSVIAAEALLQDLGTALSRNPGNQPQARQAAAAQWLQELAHAATEAAIEDLFAGLLAVSKVSAQPFIARMRDERLGFIATYRALLKAELDDPKSEPEARRVMVALGAEVFQATIRLEQLAAGTEERVKTLAGAVNALRDDIAGIETLVRRLDPKVPLGGGWTTAAAGHRRFVDLTYDQRATVLIGREAEIEKLETFLRFDKPVAWWQIAGAGGQGKSRLALELIDLAALDGWRAGFLRGENIKTVDWSSVAIDQPTLIVIDYVAAPSRARAAAAAISKLWERNNLAHSVRVLLVERAPYAIDTTSAQDRAPWFDAFCGVGRREALEKASFAPSALVLPVLSPEQMCAIARSWREGRTEDALTETAEARLLGLLGYDKENKTLKDRAWRPLFAMIFADRVAEGAAEGDTEGLSLAEALNLTLQDEKQSYWKEDDGAPVEPGAPAENLACLATMARSVPPYHAVLERDNGAFYALNEPQSWRDASMVLGVRRPDPITAAPPPSEGPEPPALKGREPDLLGEFMLTRLLSYELRRDASPRIDALMKDAWQLDPTATLEFLIRLTEDADDLGARDLRDRLAAILPPIGVSVALPGKGPGDALLFCAYYGLTALANTLVAEDRALAEHIGVNGTFPLLMAAGKGHLRVAGTLTDAGADIKKVWKQADANALDIAIIEDQASVAAYLWSLGVRPVHTETAGATISDAGEIIRPPGG